MITPLSLYEAIGTYDGFALQAQLRGHIWFISLLIFLAYAYHAWAQGMRDPDGFGGAIREYIFMGVKGCLIVMTLFPEASLIVPGITTTITGGDVISASAQSDASPVQTAAQMRASDGLDTPGVVVPWLQYQIIQQLSHISVDIGSFLHNAALRPGSMVMPLNWFMRYEFDSGIRLEIQNLVSECIKPAQRRMSNSGVPHDMQDYMPIPGTPLYNTLGTIRIASGEGLLNLINQTITCASFADRVFVRVQNALQNDRTPAGNPLSVIWADTLGLSLEEAARHLMRRDIQMILHLDRPETGIGSQYAGVQGTRIATRVGQSFLNPVGWISAPFTAGRVGLSEAERTLNRVAGLMESILFWRMSYPVATGLIQTIFIGFMPVVVLWALVQPHRSFIILGSYIGALAGAYSSPIVMGLIELRVHTISDLSISILNNPIQWADKQIAILSVQTFAPYLHIFIMLALTFGGGVAGSGMSRLSASQRG